MTATKTKFTATFSNGNVLTRTSTTGTSFAWQVLDAAGSVVGKGWASSQELAQKASSTVVHSASDLRTIGEFHTANRKGQLKLAIYLERLHFKPVGGIEAFRAICEAKADTYKTEIVQAA